MKVGLLMQLMIFFKKKRIPTINFIPAKTYNNNKIKIVLIYYNARIFFIVNIKVTKLLPFFQNEKL